MASSVTTPRMFSQFVAGWGDVPEAAAPVPLSDAEVAKRREHLSAADALCLSWARSDVAVRRDTSPDELRRSAQALIECSQRPDLYPSAVRARFAQFLEAIGGLLRDRQAPEIESRLLSARARLLSDDPTGALELLDGADVHTAMQEAAMRRDLALRYSVLLELHRGPDALALLQRAVSDASTADWKLRCRLLELQLSGRDKLKGSGGLRCPSPQESEMTAPIAGPLVEYLRAKEDALVEARRLEQVLGASEEGESRARILVDLAYQYSVAGASKAELDVLDELGDRLHQGGPQLCRVLYRAIQHGYALAYAGGKEPSALESLFAAARPCAPPDSGWDFLWRWMSAKMADLQGDSRRAESILKELKEDAAVYAWSLRNWNNIVLDHIRALRSLDRDDDADLEEEKLIRDFRELNGLPPEILTSPSRAASPHPSP